jgi:hypothetical protein
MQYPSFQKRVPLSAADLNLAMDALKRARVLPGVGIKLTETLNGTVVSLKPPRAAGGGGSSVERHPWQIHNMTGVGKPDDKGDYNSYEFQVWPGTINGLIPSNLFNGGELRKFTGDKTLKNVLLKCTSNGKELNACTIEVEASLPSPDAAVKYGVPSNLNIVLGAVVKDAAFQVEFDNLSATPQMVYIKEKGSVAAGEYPYEVYLNWIYHGYQGVGGGGGGGWYY